MLTITLQDADLLLSSVTVYVTVWLPMSRTGDPDGSVVVVNGVTELSLVVAAGNVTVASGRVGSVS